MKIHTFRTLRFAVCVAMTWIFVFQVTAISTGAYALGSSVGDMRQPTSRSGGTSCPQFTRFDVSTPGTINRQWSTSLGTNPVTILTVDQTAAGRLTEIENVIQQSLGAWTGVPGSSLKPATLFGWIEFHLPQSKRSGVRHRSSGIHAGGVRRHRRRTAFSEHASFNICRPNSRR